LRRSCRGFFAGGRTFFRGLFRDKGIEIGFLRREDGKDPQGRQSRERFDMARVDDYKKAAEIARSALKEANPKRVADRAGGRFEGAQGQDPCLVIRFLNRQVKVCWPEVLPVYEQTGEELPIQQQVLLLHFLEGSGPGAPSGEWVAYQEIPDGKFYLDPFLRRAKNPMVQTFGEQPERLVTLAAKVYGGKPAGEGDASIIVDALPGVPVLLILWQGDDEFPPEGNILFDRSIIGALSAEDIAWLCGMIIYPLVGMARQA